jgi:uncharacterized protein
LRAHRDEARRLAVRAAREKAEALAAELGQQVGNPTSIHEERIDARGGYGPWSASNVSQNAIQSGPGSLVTTATMALGQVVVSARVAVEFELR